MDKKLIAEMKKDLKKVESIHKELINMKSYDWTVLDALKAQMQFMQDRISKLESKLEHAKKREKLKVPNNVYIVDFKAKKLVA